MSKKRVEINSNDFLGVKKGLLKFKRFFGCEKRFAEIHEKPTAASSILSSV